MLHDGRAIRVAVVGGSRIPFCRSHSVYRDCTNQDLMTARSQRLCQQVRLEGPDARRRRLGAVIKHSRDWNLARESVIESGLSYERRRRPAARLRHQHRGRDHDREQDRARADRVRHRGRHRHGSDAPIVYNDATAHAARHACAHVATRTHQAVFRFRPASSSRSCPAYTNHAPACRWAKARKSLPRSGTCSASTRTSWRLRVT